ncbi:hypothetical protein NDU88_008797 [Pleurodeles waltl]|uniref:Uncharacterized protein n=1 Tax=Pleurodeles waltl TaxID=8319 RepID=A0AAV7PU47_PLEWA|nr:hypothetical protein NDU88_008797 [Pleurodeles waltl]
MILHPMPWAYRPFKRIHCLLGPRVLRFREVARWLPMAYAVSAKAEIRGLQCCLWVMDLGGEGGEGGGSISVGAYPRASRSQAGGPDHTVQSAVVAPIHPRRLPRVDGPPVTPHPMVLRALCPAEKIYCIPGPRVLRFREAVGRLPEAYAAPAIAEIWLGARSFALRQLISSVAKPRPPVSCPLV